MNNNILTDSNNTYRLCQQALTRAIEYLVKKLSPSGGWSDFPTNSTGESTSWITAHVLWHIGTLLPQKIRETAIQSLFNEQHSSGAWGFSGTTIPDCDSTLHVIHAIFRIGIKGIDLSKPIEFVLAHQLKNGGFSTYNDMDALTNFRGIGKGLNYDGWVQPHVCVTAIALETLIHFSDCVPSYVLNKAEDFLIETQSLDGYWESYWWRSKYFATTRIIQQLKSINDVRLKDKIIKALKWVIRSSNKSGYWDNGYELGNPCLLSTSSCVKSLLATDNEPDMILKNILWILGVFAHPPKLSISKIEQSKHTLLTDE